MAPEYDDIDDGTIYDDDALESSLEHSEEFWRTRPHLIEPEDDPEQGWNVDDYDIRCASFELATMLIGPDNGTPDRDELECQIQRLLKVSFERTKFRPM